MCKNEAVDIILRLYVLGKLSKQIFGKSWEFGPRRGGGADQSSCLESLRGESGLMTLGNLSCT